jgi:hypothetical protein
VAREHPVVLFKELVQYLNSRYKMGLRLGINESNASNRKITLILSGVEVQIVQDGRRASIYSPKGVIADDLGLSS